MHFSSFFMKCLNGLPPFFFQLPPSSSLIYSFQLLPTFRTYNKSSWDFFFFFIFFRVKFRLRVISLKIPPIFFSPFQLRCSPCKIIIIIYGSLFLFLLCLLKKAEFLIRMQLSSTKFCQRECNLKEMSFNS